MRYLTAWQGAIALAIVPLLHWTLLGRTLAVSGRFSAIIDGLRHRKTTAQAETPMTQADLLAAIRAETSAVFGAEVIEELPARSGETASITLPRRESLGMHVFFLVGLVLGGFVSTMVAGSFAPSFWLRGELFANFVGQSSLSHVLVPLAGGVLIGFGTRMAGGCTSGHGLCGVSQFQPGSFVATIGFFGMGVAVSFLIGALS